MANVLIRLHDARPGQALNGWLDLDLTPTGGLTATVERVTYGGRLRLSAQGYYEDGQWPPMRWRAGMPLDAWALDLEAPPKPGDKIKIKAIGRKPAPYFSD